MSCEFIVNQTCRQTEQFILDPYIHITKYVFLDPKNNPTQNVERPCRTLKYKIIEGILGNKDKMALEER